MPSVLFVLSPSLEPMHMVRLLDAVRLTPIQVENKLTRGRTGDSMCVARKYVMLDIIIRDNCGNYGVLHAEKTSVPDKPKIPRQFRECDFFPLTTLLLIGQVNGCTKERVHTVV